MPRVFDNISNSLLPALRETLAISERADFCVGYFNLRGWKALDQHIEEWSGSDDSCCRLIVGMQRSPRDELEDALGLGSESSGLDNQTVLRLKKRLATEFRDQLSRGVPTNEDEKGLRRLAKQIRAQKVRVKLFLKHTLHAKLYLLFREDPNNPTTGYVGSSNLTFAGLSHQGELNVDVLDHDACNKLAKWFQERWDERWCVDISQELAQVIEESWAREDLISPYHIYVYMAYHLSREARAGISEFNLPKEFKGVLFPFQEAAVKIAAHHLHRRRGVLIGDVVGLGKTLMATALARVFEEDLLLQTLIICPLHLTDMWEGYCHRYRLRGKVLSSSRVLTDLAELRRYPLVVIDESHNFRNREGSRYQAIREYIRENESRVILLTATPYNKSYLDLSNQLRLFVPDDDDLGIRPENLLREIGEVEFMRRHQASVRSLAAFEKSESPDDWRELMRLFMVRRTRSFVKDNYAETEQESGRQYLQFADGTKSYFPERLPKTVKFHPDRHYAALSAPEIVETINGLHLPRYGLGNYVKPTIKPAPTTKEQEQLDDLSRAGNRLMGFCRVNLFKRLESSGAAFLQSLKRHIVRNYVYLYALEADKPLPIGTQDAAWFDSLSSDVDPDESTSVGLFEDRNGDTADETVDDQPSLRDTAATIYESYTASRRGSFRWIASRFFVAKLKQHLQEDIDRLSEILDTHGVWHAGDDAKLNQLLQLVSGKHGTEKVLVFTQFADTVRYLEQELRSRGVEDLAGVTGDSADPTDIARRFSPQSNEYEITKEDEELRVVIATDVLSEGQNLQDCAIVVNYDLPWAIIRLVQRAGRVDRIGQKAEEILCYTFWPSDGVEQVLRLRSRVQTRLRENAEVVGTDETFFEDDEASTTLADLYNEKAGTLDGEVDDEVDLASYAYQIWKNAVEDDSKLERLIPEMPPVVFGTRELAAEDSTSPGVLVYMKTRENNDALSWVDCKGKIITESQYTILRAAECTPEVPASPRMEQHHKLVQVGVDHMLKEESSLSGGLGKPSGARYRVYTRLKQYSADMEGTLMDIPELGRALTEILEAPLTTWARDRLNRQLRSGINDQQLAGLVLALRDEDRLTITQGDVAQQEAQIICSQGLHSAKEATT